MVKHKTITDAHGQEWLAGPYPVPLLDDKPPRYDITDKLWLSIDPGLIGTGVAVWDRFDLVYTTILSPENGMLTVEDRMRNIFGKFNTLVGEWTSAEFMVIEGPQFFETGKGHKSARTSALIKLCQMCGGLMAVSNMHDIDVKLVSVGEWLAQRKQPMLEEEVIEAMGKDALKKGGKIKWKSHDLYAVGLGLYCQNRIM